MVDGIAFDYCISPPCESRLDGNGDPIEGNRTVAMKWLRAAAEQGLPRAQSKLAEMNANGLAAPEDDINAWAPLYAGTAGPAGGRA